MWLYSFYFLIVRCSAKGSWNFFKKTTKSRHHRSFCLKPLCLPNWSLFLLFAVIKTIKRCLPSLFFFPSPPSLVFSKKMSLCIDSKQKHVLFHKQTDTNKEGDVVTSKGCHRRGVRWSLFLPTPALLLRATMRPFEVSRPMQKLLCRHLKKSRAFTFVYYRKVFFSHFHSDICLLLIPRSFPAIYV